MPQMLLAIASAHTTKKHTLILWTERVRIQCCTEHHTFWFRGFQAPCFGPQHQQHVYSTRSTAQHTLSYAHSTTFATFTQTRNVLTLIHSHCAYSKISTWNDDDDDDDKRTNGNNNSNGNGNGNSNSYNGQWTNNNPTVLFTYPHTYTHTKR